MIVPIPGSGKYREGVYTSAYPYASMSLLELFSGVKAGEGEITHCLSQAPEKEEHKIFMDEKGISAPRERSQRSMARRACFSRIGAADAVSRPS